jgi:Zn-finger nucleic acid-binding protein
MHNARDSGPPLERLTAAETGWYSEQPRPAEQPRYSEHRSDDRYQQHGYKKKRRSFLEDLFD